METPQLIGGFKEKFEKFVYLYKVLKAENKQLKFDNERLKEEFPHLVKSIRYTKSTSTLLNKYSFMLISYQAWNTLSVSENKELRNIPSTLIINKKVSRFHTGARNKFVEHIEVDVDSDRF